MADVVICVADAKVAPTILHAVSPVRALGVHVARCGCNLKFTEEPKEAWRALAEGRVGTQASASIAALTVIVGSLPTVQAHEAFWALAHVALICIHTCATILARG